MSAERWGLEWRVTDECIDGSGTHLMWHKGWPLLFNTRQEARNWAAQRYGYIKYRPDLRRHPHGWRMPQPVRVRVRLEKVRG